MFKEKFFFKIFSLFFFILLFTLLLIVNELKSPDFNYFNFSSIKNKYFISTKGLSRTSIQNIKMAYIESEKKIDLGLFGNHIVQYHSKDKVEMKKSFFNFWYANLSLTEIHHFLIYLDQIGKLPEKILIAVTTPNNDNGGSIIRYGGELPIKYINFNKILKDLKNNQTEFFSFFLKYFSLNKYFEHINYINLYELVYELISKKKLPTSYVEDKLISIKECEIKINICSYSLRYDGSAAFDYSSTRNLVKNGEGDDRLPQLKQGDDDVIFYQISSINNFLKSRKKEVVFFIPPVYEDERPTYVQSIFNQGLKKLDKNINILDHRYLRKEREYFVHFDHTNEKYFKFLLGEALDKYAFDY